MLSPAIPTRPIARAVGMTRFLVASLAALMVLLGAGMTAGNTSAYAYDGPPVVRPDVHEVGAAEAESNDDAGAREGNASPPVEPRGTSTTSSTRIIATEAETDASSAANGARLNEQLRLTEKYGAGGVEELPDGRMRFSGETTPAKTPGEMAGALLVREWDPATGAQRTWYETLDQEGNIRIVRPETGGPKVRYTFGADGSYAGPR